MGLSADERQQLLDAVARVESAANDSDGRWLVVAVLAIAGVGLFMGLVAVLELV